MLSENIVLSARNISKKYSTRKRSLFKKASQDDFFWALKDINFDLKRGEILGIIGMNGAGKSTLLKILSEVIPPTSGEIEYTGNILSILDIGTGFHPDLSGYENIFLNASLLGMKKKEILKQADAIINFSGIRDHIHEPVKTYSNGMYLRLAFSISLFVPNEILLLDEVIAVGDVEFRNKATEKIKQQVKEGKSCILISHDLNTILDLCTDCMLIEKGEMIYKGNSKKVIEDYYAQYYSNHTELKDQVLENSLCRIVSVMPEKERFYMDEPLTIKIRFELKKETAFRCFLKIRSYHSRVLTSSNAFDPINPQEILAPGIYESNCQIPANIFNAGAFLVDVIIGTETEIFIEYNQAFTFTVLFRDWELHKSWNTTNEVYPVRPLCNWQTLALSKSEY